MSFLMITDKRLGRVMPPRTYNVEVDETFDLRWLADLVLSQPHAITLIFSSHGRPGFAQCCKGAVAHPTAGPGISVHDLPTFARMRKKINAIEFRSCLVARIGTAPECQGEVGWDGNAFCYRLAQAARATVKASLHLQYGDSGEFCGWAGTVFTWGASGSIINRTDYPMNPACMDLGGSRPEPNMSMAD